jgi:hypothetical protein
MPLGFLRRHSTDEAADGPIASHAGGMISALFLLIFAIAVIVPWTVADSARQNTYTEAGALEEAAWAARGLPPSEDTATQLALRGYATFVTATEWREMRRGQLDPKGWQRLDELRGRLVRLDLKDDNQASARDAVVAQLATVYAARRQRAVDARATLPSGVLALTVVTAIFVMLFPLLAGARPRGWVWVAYGMLGISLAVGVYLVFAIDHTFSGPLGVGPKAFMTALTDLARVP